MFELTQRSNYTFPSPVPLPRIVDIIMYKAKFHCISWPRFRENYIAQLMFERETFCQVHKTVNLTYKEVFKIYFTFNKFYFL